MDSAETYWRIRMREGDERTDHSEQAWNRGEVGIWYGAWTADDLAKAESSGDAARYLTRLPAQKALGWEVSEVSVSTARRFRNIPDRHWVILYFDNCLHLARLSSAMKSEPSHPLSMTREIFKFRTITEKKTLNLAHLPDVCRLIPSAGRSNIHQYKGYWELVRLLADSPNESEVMKRLRSLPLDRALKLLGDTGWESFCLGYLILEASFVPTGLLLGRTLRDHDIVGRSLRNGGRIFAQCKKSPYQVPIADGFLESCQNLGPDDRAYYFAYGGCSGVVPRNVKVVSFREVEEWAETEKGKRYLEMFFK